MTPRLATPADADRIIQLGGRCPSAPQWSEQQYRGLFDPTQPRRMLVLVVEDCNAPAPANDAPTIKAFLVASQIGTAWDLESIVVDPSAVRCGLGTRLLTGLSTQVTRAGGGTIFLEVRASNSAARAFYENSGFAIAGHRRRYYTNPDEDAILYHRYI